MKAWQSYFLMLLGFSSFVLFLRQPASEDRAKVLPYFRAARKHGPGRADVYGPKLEHIQFDPMLGEREMRKEDMIWENERVREAQEEQRDEIISAATADSITMPPKLDADNPSEVLDMPGRLRFLFPLIDKDHSEAIAVEELTAWHQGIARNTSLHRTWRELMQADADKDGLVTLAEYLRDPLEGEEGAKEWPLHSQEWLRSSRETFPLADLDKDGKLNLEEFNDFLHPEDSANEALLRYLRVQEIRDRDTDNDGKISFDEFVMGMYDELRDYKAEEDEDAGHAEWHRHRQTEGPGADWDDRPRGGARSRGDYIAQQQAKSNQRLARARHQFDELDKNRDSFLTEEELRPVLEKLQPGENYYSRVHSENLMKQADDNKDRLLTLDEMLRHYPVFYDSTDEEEDAYLHDEFR